MESVTANGETTEFVYDGSGTTVYAGGYYEVDSSGETVPNYALDFDGVNDYVLVPDSPSNGNFSSQITLEAWIDPDGFPGGGGDGLSCIVTKGSAYYFSLDTTGHLQFYWYDLSIPGYHRSPNVIPTDKWTHVAATYDGSTVRLYENGVQVYSRAVTGNGRTNAYPVGIGRYPRSAVRHFNGRIDEVRILDRASSASEIRGDFNAKGPYPTRSGVVGWYHLDENTGSTVTDASGNGNTGTRYGAAWAVGMNGGAVDDFEYTDSPLDHDWKIYTGSGSIATVTASGRPGRVLRTTTSQGTGFGIRYPASGSIDVPLRELSVWIKDTDTFYFYVRVHATNGSDYYIRYQPTGGSPYASGSYAIVPVGTQYRNGSWHELRRDLGADLRSVFGVGVEYVKWFCIRGNYDLDDLELTDSTKYYYANGQRVAMREGGVVQYLHTDHLGSTSLTTDGNGAEVARQLYYPYGEERWSSGTLATDYQFTGQRNETGLGLMDYNARFYDPYLGRFISADTIVPQPGNPQSLNRYSYVLGNPLKYRDPSGHAECRMLVNPSNGNVMIADTGGSALYQLILLASLGNDTAANRLVEILDATSSGPWLHFSGLGARRGDTGFRSEFGDDHLYGNLWGVETPASRQVGHFLTAVDMGYGPGRWENSLIRSIVGHEMVTDAETKVGMPFRTMAQIAKPGTGEINLFKAAARLDAANCPLCDVDAALFPLFDPAKYGKQEDRIGNSMEDLRLSVRGWRLGQMVESGDIKTNKDLANWIALNVAE